jgi:hypothetical protein
VLGQMVGNDVMSKVDHLTYVVLSRTEKHMLMGNYIVGTTVLVKVYCNIHSTYLTEK